MAADSRTPGKRLRSVLYTGEIELSNNLFPTFSKKSQTTLKFRRIGLQSDLHVPWNDSARSCSRDAPIRARSRCFVAHDMGGEIWRIYGF